MERLAESSGLSSGIEDAERRNAVEPVMQGLFITYFEAANQNLIVLDRPAVAKQLFCCAKLIHNKFGLALVNEETLRSAELPCSDACGCLLSRAQ